MARFWASMVAALLLVSGCSLVFPAEVRFQNDIPNYSYTYGIRLGQASYSSILTPNDTSPYSPTKPGTYDVETRTSTGIWQVASQGPFTVGGYHWYTLTATTQSWTLTIDR